MLLPLIMVLALVGAAEGSFCGQRVVVFPEHWHSTLPRNAHFIVVPPSLPAPDPGVTSAGDPPPREPVELFDETTGEALPIQVERIEDGDCLALRVRPMDLLSPRHTVVLRAPTLDVIEWYTVNEDEDLTAPVNGELLRVDWHGFSVRTYSSGVRTWGEDDPPAFSMYFHSEHDDEPSYHEVQLLREDGTHSPVLPLVGRYGDLQAGHGAPDQGMTAALREIVATGEPVRLRARPVDMAGNRGAWSESGTLRVPLGPTSWEHPRWFGTLVGIANLHATYVMTLTIAIGIAWCFILNTAIVREQPRRWGYARPAHRRWALPRQGAARTRAQDARIPGEPWRDVRAGWRMALGVLERDWLR